MSLMNASWFTKLNMFPYLIRNIHITAYNILYTMHSNIYQVSTEKISKDQFITEATFSDCDYSFFDWCANLPEEEQEQAIDQLVDNLLPKGMFSRNSDEPRTIIYHGGADDWKRQWVERIHKRAEAITPENVTEWIGSTYRLEQELEDPLDIGSRFVTSDYESSDAQKSSELMKQICTLKPGTKLYIGGIIDYHW